MSEDSITAEESVALYRQLAEEDPAFRSDLAISLVNLSIDLAGAGRREAALAAISEAVAICQELPKAEVIRQSLLAHALDHLGVRLAEMGRHA